MTMHFKIIAIKIHALYTCVSLKGKVSHINRLMQRVYKKFFNYFHMLGNRFKIKHLLCKNHICTCVNEIFQCTRILLLNGIF